MKIKYTQFLIITFTITTKLLYPSFVDSKDNPHNKEELIYQIHNASQILGSHVKQETESLQRKSITELRIIIASLKVAHQTAYQDFY